MPDNLAGYPASGKKNQIRPNPTDYPVYTLAVTDHISSPRQEGWIHHLARRSVACYLTCGELDVHISREYSQYWEKSLVQLILTTMAMGCGTSIFVDVSVAQLA